MAQVAADVPCGDVALHTRVHAVRTRPGRLATVSHRRMAVRARRILRARRVVDPDTRRGGRLLKNRLMTLLAAVVGNGRSVSVGGAAEESHRVERLLEREHRLPQTTAREMAVPTGDAGMRGGLRRCLERLTVVAPSTRAFAHNIGRYKRSSDADHEDGDSAERKPANRMGLGASHVGGCLGLGGSVIAN